MNTYRTQNYIQDKVIVITGASSGFGKETAKKAAELGIPVISEADFRAMIPASGSNSNTIIEEPTLF